MHRLETHRFIGDLVKLNKVEAQVDLVQGDVAALSGWAKLRADTVIMNPPFGTRSKGADIAFLQAGIQVLIY